MEDDVLLDHGDLGKVDLHAHVAPGDHDRVGGGQDLVDVIYALAVFDLGDDAHFGVARVQQAADLLDVLGAAGEAGSHKIEPLLDAEQDVVFIALAHVGHRKAHARHVYALVVADGAAVVHPALDVCVGKRGHGHADQAVGQQNGAAHGKVARQVFVGDGAHFGAALHLAGGEGEGLACFEMCFAAGKLL